LDAAVQRRLDGGGFRFLGGIFGALEFIDAGAFDIKAQHGVVLGKFQGKGHADIAKANDGNVRIRGQLRGIHMGKGTHRRTFIP
jgi:hypothetical protein